MYYTSSVTTFMIKCMFLAYLFANQLLTYGLYAQDSNSAFALLSENVGSVEFKKDQYNQTLNKQATDDCLLAFSRTEDETETIYSFNAIDVNEQKIHFDTKRDHVFVDVFIQKNEDFIKVEKDRELTGYEDHVQIYCQDIDEARMITQQMKILVSTCKDMYEEFTKRDIFNQQSDVISFLQNQIRDYSINDDIFTQSFSVNNQRSHILTYTFSNGFTDKVFRYSVNAADLNVNAISVSTKGREILVNLETKQKRNYIQVWENEEQAHFSNTFYIRAASIVKAREIAAGMRAYVRFATKDPIINVSKELQENYPGLLSYLTEHIGEVTILSDLYRQAFSVLHGSQETIIQFTQVNESKEEQIHHTINLADVPQRNISFFTKGREVMVMLETAERKRLIEVKKDGNVVAYENELIIRANSIEEARNLETTLKAAANIAYDRYQNNFTSQYPEASLDQAISFCEKQIGEVTVGRDIFHQAFHIQQNEQCKITLSTDNLSKEESESFKFNASDIKAISLDYQIKGKEIFLSGKTKNEKEIIQFMKNGETEDYKDTFSIRCANIEQARALVDAFRIIIENCSEHSN